MKGEDEAFVRRLQSLERAHVVTEIRSLRGFIITLLVVAVLSLGLNGVRTYLVDNQIKKLTKENMELRIKLEKAQTYG